MIKKLLSAVLLITSVGVINSSAQALCTTNYSCVPTGTDFGICPDSATGLPSAIVNQAYTVTMSIKIPASTVSGGMTFSLTHLALEDVKVDLGAGFVALSNLGLTYLGSGTNAPSGGVAGITSYTMTKYGYWDAPGGSCVIVSGTPNATGDFPIRIISQARVNAFGSLNWTPAPDNNDYHLLVTSVTAGIETLDLSKFDVEQNAPNPFGDKSEIRFSSVNTNDIEFKVYDMLGSVVYNNKFKSTKGMNTITIEANSFSPGVYMYSVKNGDNTITKRMIVSGK